MILTDEKSLEVRIDRIRSCGLFADASDEDILVCALFFLENMLLDELGCPMDVDFIDLSGV